MNQHTSKSFVHEVEQVLAEVSRIPYENLSKIVAFHKHDDLFHALDTPEKMYRKSQEVGAGGTCYALTFYLKELLFQKGFSSEFLLGDKYKMKGIHCGLLIAWEGYQYLLDPGYMIYKPLLLPSGGLITHTYNEPNDVYLEDFSQDYWRMYTSGESQNGSGQEKKFRFDFRKTPLNEKEFVKYWKDTFFLQMMDYPVLNKVEKGVQYYLQKNSFVTRTREGSELIKITREKFTELGSSLYGLSEELIEEYLVILSKSRRDFFTG